LESVSFPGSPRKFYDVEALIARSTNPVATNDSAA
jgi:hypothetical protein